MKKNTIYIIVIVVAMVLMFIPTTRGQKGPDRPQLKTADIEPFRAYLESSDLSSFDAVLRLFDDNDVVFLGEFYKIRQGLDYVRDLIPLLHDRGVYDLGIEYALSGDQAKIDAVLAGVAYDEQAVKDILFDRMVIWGYQEYADLFKAAWEFNRTLPPDSPRFRILGLSVDHDWSHITTQEDAKDPEILRKVLSAGLPDVHMAEVVRKEILIKGRKAAVFSGIQHAFTAYRQERYRENMEESGFDETRRLGNLVYDYTGGRAATVMFHSPWPDGTQPQGYGYALQGIIDRAIDLLPEDKTFGAFAVADSPLADVQVLFGEYAYGMEDLPFADLCDAYVLMGPVRKLEPCRVMDGFITEANFATVLARFPGPKPENVTSEDIVSYLWEEMEQLAKMVELF